MVSTRTSYLECNKLNKNFEHHVVWDDANPTMCALAHWLFPKLNLDAETWVECRLVLNSLHDLLSLNHAKLVMAWGKDAANLLQDTVTYMNISSESDKVLRGKWLSMVDCAGEVWEGIVKGQTIFSTQLDDLEEVELQLPYAEDG